MVNTDRRNTQIDQIFRIGEDRGLNDFLRSDADRFAAHFAIEHASQRLGIRMLSTGTGPEVSLSSSALKALIDAAAERNMTVIFDTPPALTHAGGLQIAAIADTVHVVAAAGKTRRSDLKQLLGQLHNVQAHIGGAVFNRTSRLNLLPTANAEVAAVSTPTDLAGDFDIEEELSRFESEPQTTKTIERPADPRINLAPTKLEEEPAEDYASASGAVATESQDEVESFSNFTGLFGENHDGEQ